MSSRVNPWLHTHVEILEAHQRVGLRCRSLTIRYSLRTPGKPYALVFFWPRGEDYRVDPAAPSALDVRARHGEARVLFEGGKTQEQSEIEASAAALTRVYTQFGRQREVPSLDEQYANHYRVAVVNGEQPIALEFRLDTDDIGFVQLAQAHEQAVAEGKAPGRISQPVTVMALDEDRSTYEVRDIAVEFAPGTYPPRDPGDLAIDLGNTNSAIVYLPVHADRSSEIEVLDVTGHPCPECPEDCTHSVLVPTAAAIDSNVRVTHAVLNDDRSLPADLGSVRWTIGAVQAEGDNNGLYMGVKRLLTSPPGEKLRAKVFDGLVAGEGDPMIPMEVGPSVPAELFLCRLFQRFREARTENPDRFAITYPTTYSRSELEQIREAVFRGWLRAMEHSPPADISRDDRVARHIPRMIDEASAGGFYFLFREVFEMPHGLARFRYLYPDGFNLLLYDCGGGTTDVAILRAEVTRDVEEKPTARQPARPATPGRPPAAPAATPKEGPKLTIDVKVLGRSGERDFGGDNITEAIFRILKAKLALAMVAATPALAPRVSGAKPVWPTDLAELEDFLIKSERNRAYFNAVLRTTFNRNEYEDIDHARARRLTLELWAHAEEMKRSFGVLKENGDLPQTQGLSLSGNTPLHKVLQAAKVKDSGGAVVEVHRDEVDALIGPNLRSSINRCNRLMYEKLTEPGYEIHRVVVAGKATLYPLFRDEVTAHLAVPFLHERLEWLDSEEKQADLKFAVAKGAVLALCKDRVAGNVKVKFDDKLPDRVPFHLAYWDDETKWFEPLLREGEEYEALVNGRELRVHPPVEGEKRDSDKLVALYRRWPGDEIGKETDLMSGYKRYLTFRFEKGLRPPVRVIYLKDEHQFMVRDQSGNGVLIEGDILPDCSPPQRGTL